MILLFGFHREDAAWCGEFYKTDLVEEERENHVCACVRACVREQQVMNIHTRSFAMKSSELPFRLISEIVASHSYWADSRFQSNTFCGACVVEEHATA